MGTSFSFLRSSCMDTIELAFRERVLGPRDFIEPVQALRP